MPTYLSATLLAGVYSTPAIYGEVRAVFTNTVPVDAYRGAGRPETTYLLERLVDVIAHDTGLDRVAIRPAQLHRGRRLPVSGRRSPCNTTAATMFASSTPR